VVPTTDSRDDSHIIVLTLNALIKDELDMRFAADSIGNSDLCFLPLFPSDWRLLEEEFGRELVDRRFLVIPPTFDEFMIYQTYENGINRYIPNE
jgi:hypothetical protein